MKALVDSDVRTFVDRALGWVAREPVINNVVATNVEAVSDGRRRYDDALWITVLDDDDEVVGAAMHTPPYHLFVCSMPVDAARAAAEGVIAVRPDLSGVTGETQAAAAFARHWQQLTGAGLQPGMASRIYCLESVTAPAPAPVAGRLRPASAGDRAQLIDWTASFMREAVPHQHGEDAATTVDRMLADGHCYLWDLDSQPVCYAGARRPAAGVARIGPVYTPPPQRCRGYASACVAEVSRRLLLAGARRCALYTDLANPTSNGIYQRLGYRPVADSQEYGFTC